MAIIEDGGVNRAAQPPKLDHQGLPLIAANSLPFIDVSKEYAQRIQWSPPAGYFDGLRYGLECALAMLRVAPQGGYRQRVDEVSFFGHELLEQQVKRIGSGKSGAYWAHWQFWETILDFTMQPATAANVAHYRSVKLIGFLSDEVADLRNRLKSTKRARTRGKAVRS